MSIKIGDESSILRLCTYDFSHEYSTLHRLGFLQTQKKFDSFSSLIQIRIHKWKSCMNTNAKSVFKDPNVARCSFGLYDTYVVVPAEKAPKTMFLFLFVNLITYAAWQRNALGNIFPTKLTEEEIVNYRWSVVSSLEISSRQDSNVLKCYYKQLILQGLPNISQNLFSS